MNKIKEVVKFVDTIKFVFECEFISFSIDNRQHRLLNVKFS